MKRLTDDACTAEKGRPFQTGIVLGKNEYLYAFTEADRGINVLSCESGDFQKRRTFVYLWTDENGGFLIRHDVMHHVLIAPCMLCEGCYRTFIVLWTGESDSSTLLVDPYFFANGREKNFRFQRTGP